VRAAGVLAEGCMQPVGRMFDVPAVHYGVSHGCRAVTSELVLQGAAFNVTHFESRITHLFYTAINITEHG
jgi:hypothetical protein